MHITLSFKKRFFFIKYRHKETECHKYETLIYSRKNNYCKWNFINPRTGRCTILPNIIPSASIAL